MRPIRSDIAPLPDSSDFEAVSVAIDQVRTHLGIGGNTSYDVDIEQLSLAAIERFESNLGMVVVPRLVTDRYDRIGNSYELSRSNPMVSPAPILRYFGIGNVETNSSDTLILDLTAKRPRVTVANPTMHVLSDFMSAPVSVVYQAGMELGDERIGALRGYLLSYVSAVMNSRGESPEINERILRFYLRPFRKVMSS